jgi:hypothetical protein
LANRLQTFIQELIHQNQYGFIKTRTIQDCLVWVFNYLHICHHSRKEVIILKLDFEKAFDKPEQEFILEILRHKGFGQTWISWIQNILSSGTTKVLLNGVLSKTIHCRGGVRQGDALSPLLFVLATDFIQTTVNSAMRRGLINRPIPLQSSPDFPIMQYADDTLLIMEADTRQLVFMKALLNSFAEAAGLKVNFSKSVCFK